MTYQLGVDVGTTFTAAGIADATHCEPFALGGRSLSVPTTVFIDGPEVLVGETAERRALSRPTSVAREFKRRMGDPTPLFIAGEEWSANDLIAKVLRWVYDRVVSERGEPPARVTITHPASWGDFRLDLLRQAASDEGLPSPKLMPEPAAAAAYYASQRHVESDATVAVYDLGGGTFDAAVVRRQHGAFEVVGTPRGIERLGGVDFDELVFEHVRSSVPDLLDAFDPEDPAALADLADLRANCIVAKEALAEETVVTIPVRLPGMRREVRLTRDELQGAVRPLLERTLDELRAAIESAHIDATAIDAVLLVGGASRMPLVGQLVGAAFARPVVIDAHPKLAICLGAAVHGTSAPIHAGPPSVAPGAPVWPDTTERAFSAAEIARLVASVEGSSPNAIEAFLAVGANRYVLRTREAVIGRRDRSGRQTPDIDFTDVDAERSVSRKHAVLRMNGRNASITDLGSHNGTFVNGRRLGADEACQLHDGDTLRFGVVDASYRLGT